MKNPIDYRPRFKEEYKEAVQILSGGEINIEPSDKNLMIRQFASYPPSNVVIRLKETFDYINEILDSFSSASYEEYDVNYAIENVDGDLNAIADRVLKSTKDEIKGILDGFSNAFYGNKSIGYRASSVDNNIYALMSDNEDEINYFSMHLDLKLYRLIGYYSETMIDFVDDLMYTLSSEGDGNGPKELETAILIINDSIKRALSNSIYEVTAAAESEKIIGYFSEAYNLRNSYIELFIAHESLRNTEHEYYVKTAIDDVSEKFDKTLLNLYKSIELQRINLQTCVSNIGEKYVLQKLRTGGENDDKIFKPNE